MSLFSGILNFTSYIITHGELLTVGRDPVDPVLTNPVFLIAIEFWADIGLWLELVEYMILNQTYYY